MDRILKRSRHYKQGRAKLIVVMGQSSLSLYKNLLKYDLGLKKIDLKMHNGNNEKNFYNQGDGMIKLKTLSLIALALLSVTQGNTFANTYQGCSAPDCCDNGGWYGVVEAGYAWSFHTGIKNPDPSFWDNATEGYDARVGNAPYFTIGFGKQFCNLYCFDVNYSYYQTFHYQKFQSGISSTPGFTGARRTRFFDLDHQNVLFNFTLRPSDCFCFNFCSVNFTPFAGVGIGIGIHKVNNFHTVAFVSTQPPVGSTTSIGNSRTHTDFAWQATAGLNIQPFSCYSCLSLDIGYHYYDGGRFKGPSKIVTNTADTEGGYNTGAPWRGRLKANEIFFALNWKI